MINDIFGKVPLRFGKSLFANDGAIWKKGKNIQHIYLQTQEALDQIVQWADK